jgi:hypothetical protein
MEPLTVSFTYRVDPESGWETPDTLIASAFVQSFRPNFELLSADSAWTDTLHVDESRTHTFIIRPLIRAAVYNCVGVSASVEEALTIGANDCVLIKIP